jgi:predicted RNase H-like HicB family nuclease
MYTYQMILSWSDEDHAWIVIVPELPGCFADGPTPQEAIDNAQEVIGIWIKTAQEDGEQIPEPQHFHVSATA